VESTAVLIRMMHTLIDWWAIYSWFKNFSDDVCTEVMSAYILNYIKAEVLCLVLTFSC